MFSRALIVLLLVLNVGVAIWWASRTPSPPPALIQPTGVASLQLLSEAPARAHSQPLPATIADVNPPAPGHLPAATAQQCFSLGPFATTAAATAARTRLQAGVIRSGAREQLVPPPRGWRVYVPPQGSPEAAQALATRLAAAGFSDLLVVRDGAEANAIALGRYRGEDAARQHAAALVAAGFAARAEPLGDVQATHWLDVAAAAGADPARMQASVAAPQRRVLDCARIR